MLRLLENQQPPGPPTWTFASPLCSPEEVLDAGKAGLLQVYAALREYKVALTQQMDGTLEWLLWLQQGCRLNLLRCRRWAWDPGLHARAQRQQGCWQPT